MALENKIRDSARLWGADYCGVADLSPAREAIEEQGGPALLDYPRAISVGVALMHPIVQQLPHRRQRAVAVSYSSHCYDIVNIRLDQITSRMASALQRDGHRVFPVAASKRVDDDRICGLVSHKLCAHLAGLGWIGNNCLLITPDMGPRVRWATVLTDAPLAPTGEPMESRCGDCSECKDICPVRAIKGHPFHREEPREMRFEASRCNSYFASMRAKNLETAVCGLCLYACPHGMP